MSQVEGYSTAMRRGWVAVSRLRNGYATRLLQTSSDGGRARAPFEYLCRAIPIVMISPARETPVFSNDRCHGAVSDDGSASPRATRPRNGDGRHSRMEQVWPTSSSPIASTNGLHT
jgi:hypothetical protein